MVSLSFELGLIRPPSEAYSLLIRATRNCPWNRCKFCRTYKGEKFSLRTVEEIKQDIAKAKAVQDRIMELAQKQGDSIASAAAAVYNSAFDPAVRNVALWMYAGGESAFLQDANSLIMKAGDLVQVLSFLKDTFPSIHRVTTYARSHTATKKTPEELAELREAGLSRIHIGLETGYDPLLQYMDKGVTAAVHIAGGRKVKESGISLSEYVILGLGGEKLWREHATETARVLNEIDPDFIRVRTLTVTGSMPLHEELESGSFIRASDERIIEEERLLIKSLTCRSHFVSDHVTNLLQEVEGKLPEDKERMLAVIDRFLALSSEEKTSFKIGRRLGIYTSLDDLDDSARRRAVAENINRLRNGNGLLDDKKLYALMEGFI
ncbi:MAG: radical SAM protein [Chloroflexi bacterium]|nr:radical SAM protein [Chloroflexota bacterium]